MFIIAGLGNPGRKYAGTRHNSGFMALDTLADHCGITIGTKGFGGLTGSGFIEGEKVLLIKPQTFMNLSGDCIAPACSYYRVDPQQNLIVIYDDISLDAGQLRVRAKGSAGGHNGIKSIIERLGTQDFKRVRIGVGHVPAGYDQADWVLGKFPSAQQTDMIDAFERAAMAASALVHEPTEQVMNRFNTKITKEE